VDRSHSRQRIRRFPFGGAILAGFFNSTPLLRAISLRNEARPRNSAYSNKLVVIAHKEPMVQIPKKKLRSRSTGAGRIIEWRILIYLNSPDEQGTSAVNANRKPVDHRGSSLQPGITDLRHPLDAFAHSHAPHFAGRRLTKISRSCRTVREVAPSCEIQVDSERVCWHFASLRQSAGGRVVTAITLSSPAAITCCLGGEGHRQRLQRKSRFSAISFPVCASRLRRRGRFGRGDGCSVARKSSEIVPQVTAAVPLACDGGD